MPIFNTRQQSSSVTTTPVWIRWMPFWHGLFYVVLVLANGIDLMDGSRTWQHKGVQLGLSLALGLWYGVCVVLSPLFWQKHSLLTIGYFIVGWTLWFGLTEVDPIFLFILTGLYPQVFILPRLSGKIVGAILLTVLSAWQQVMLAGGVEGNLFLMLAVAIAGIIMALFIYAIEEQSLQRQRLIGELEGTRQALAAAEKQAGIMEERQRLAGEIHDTLAQGVTSIVMHLEAAEAAFPTDLSTLHHYLNQARRTARENLAEARRVLWALQPVMLDRASLAEALTHLAARWTEESAVRAFATVTGTPQLLRPEIEVTLLRAAQEALANARKHARASQVALTLSYMDDMVVLDVQDNGVGFDPTRPCASLVDASGFGLKALRERAQQLGGTLSIESASGNGTTITVMLPTVNNEALMSQKETKEAYI